MGLRKEMCDTSKGTEVGPGNEEMNLCEESIHVLIPSRTPTDPQGAKKVGNGESQLILVLQKAAKTHMYHPTNIVHENAPSNQNLKLICFK